MTTAFDTIPDMGKRSSSNDGKPKPNRRPAVTLYARVDPKIGETFLTYVESLRPKTTGQAVIEMLIEQHLRGLGLLTDEDDTKE